VSIATIPLTGEVATLIGPAAQHVENRSLLLDKFVFHKRWPVVEEQTRRGRDFVKWDEASRWSFMRIAEDAGKILSREANDKRRKAEGKNVEPENRQRFIAEAKIAETLANVKWDSKELQSLRASHTRHFLGLFRRAYGDRAAVTIGQLEGRLAINLADSLIQNAGICLDRLFGLPYIPGSAVKGVCRHAALEELKAASRSARKELFDLVVSIFGCAKNDFEPAKPPRKQGDNGKPAGDFYPFLDLTKPKDQKGAISFLPAYPVNEAKVVVDLTNVHYSLYYGGDKNRNILPGRPESLADENPKPNPFPAVETGAQFAFCLVLNGRNNRPELLNYAKRWLEVALTERGLGAKTAAGYGWFSLQPQVLAQIIEEEQRARELAEEESKKAAEARAKEIAEAKRIASLPQSEVARERFLKLGDEAFARAVSEMANLSADEQKGLLLALLSPEKKDTWKRWKKSDKPANKARVEALLAAAKTHGVSLP
jgi:CRISPR type III-B/RAMP module RAMP protein Cmr6